MVDASVAASLTPGKWDCWAKLVAISMTASTTSTSHFPDCEQRRGLSCDRVEPFVSATTSSVRATVVAEASTITSSGRVAVVSDPSRSSSVSLPSYFALCLLHEHIKAAIVASVTTMEDTPNTIEETAVPDPDSTSVGTRDGGVSKTLGLEVFGGKDVGPRDVETGETINGNVGTTVGAGKIETGPEVDARRGFRPTDVGAGDDGASDAGRSDVRTASAGAREEGPGVGFLGVPSPLVLMPMEKHLG